MKSQRSDGRTILIQDLGMVLFLAAVFLSAFLTVEAGEETPVQNLVLLIGLSAVSMLAALRIRTAAVILTAFEILAFSAYKLFRYAAYHMAIEMTAYCWPFLILAALGGMSMFVSKFALIEGSNSMLHRQIEELTVIDPLTGLENIRSLYAALRRQIAMGKRYGTSFGVMICKLRYPSELKKVLSRREWDELRNRSAVIAEDTLRIEDRLFSYDDNGSLAVIYFSEEDGAQIVKNRLLAAFSKEDAYPRVRGERLRVEFVIAYRQYDREKVSDPYQFIRQVEAEFAYEV